MLGNRSYMRGGITMRNHKKVGKTGMFRDIQNDGIFTLFIFNELTGSQGNFFRNQGNLSQKLGRKFAGLRAYPDIRFRCEIQNFEAEPKEFEVCILDSTQTENFKGAGRKSELQL